TGGWDTFRDVSADLTNRPAGTTTLYLVFKGGSGSLFDLDDFTFTTGQTTPAGRDLKGIGGKCAEAAGGASADGTQIQLWTCNQSAAQKWTAGTDDTYRALGKCLDISGAGTADGTKIQLYGCNGTGAQKWVAQADGTLKNPVSGKCLDASGAASADGTKLHLWTCHTGANQKWTLT
ncbi:ricin-type beta-trefoil lectin domain protein, partial [Streptomyces sp. MBT57]|nr:ricin-type beta-trefoil lectin domain protein [Streptomyces sp. MBT57]